MLSIWPQIARRSNCPRPLPVGVPGRKKKTPIFPNNEHQGQESTCLGKTCLGSTLQVERFVNNDFSACFHSVAVGLSTGCARPTGLNARSNRFSKLASRTLIGNVFGGGFIRVVCTWAE